MANTEQAEEEDVVPVENRKVAAKQKAEEPICICLMNLPMIKCLHEYQSYEMNYTLYHMTYTLVLTFEMSLQIYNKFGFGVRINELALQV